MTSERDTLRKFEIGGGVVRGDDPWELSLPPKDGDYANAQLDDHRQLPRSEFPWNPPVDLRLRARVEPAQPQGTFGFGFWNDPFAFSFGQAGAARRLPAAPQAVWFFYGSPPNDLSFTPGVPGDGWRAASLRTPRLPSWLLAAPAAAAAALSALPLIRRPVIRLAKATVTAAERALPHAPDRWHEYRLRWTAGGVTFWVNGDRVLHAPSPPRGPLGFVAWIDNQYAAVTPTRGLRFGVLPTEAEQRLELQDLHISTGTSS
ncbi:MAG: hypothetical protein R3191_02365 [Anaerolineales bacterium]|nr:hypothetical protein [Anaerolineales bacterium]